MPSPAGSFGTWLGLRLLGSHLLRLLLGRRLRRLLLLALLRALVDLLRRRHRASLANELDEALGDLDHLVRLRQRNVDQRKDGAEHERCGETLNEKLAEALVVFAATDPWHRHDARGLGGGLPLDDPLVAQILFRLLLLGEVVLEDREDVAPRRNLVDDGLAAPLDLREALVEARDALPRALEVAGRAPRRHVVAPEQALRAELGELFEGTAGLLEHQVLLALKSQRFELARDRVQIALQTAELIERLVDLSLQRL